MTVETLGKPGTAHLPPREGSPDPKISTHMARPDEIDRLGQIAAGSFMAKTRFSFGKDVQKTAAIFSDFFRIGFFPPEHTIVAEIDNRIVGFATLKLIDEKVSLRAFYRSFRTRLGVLMGLRGLLIVPWLTGGKFDDKTQMYLEFIAVEPEYRNCGVGSRLLEEIYRYGVASGRKEACGYVVCGSKAAELYKRFGMTVEPPDYELSWLSSILYNFRGYSRLIWPLGADLLEKNGTQG